METLQILRQSNLYHERHRKDACGVGFIAHLNGKCSHDMIKTPTMDEPMDHRGASGSDPAMSDGAGILVQMPDKFLRHQMATDGTEVPPEGHYGSGFTSSSLRLTVHSYLPLDRPQWRDQHGHGQRQLHEGLTGAVTSCNFRLERPAALEFMRLGGYYLPKRENNHNSLISSHLKNFVRELQLSPSAQWKFLTIDRKPRNPESLPSPLQPEADVSRLKTK